MKGFVLLIISCLISLSIYSDERKELWSEGRESLAVWENGDVNFCYVQIGETEVDVSRVENINIGKLGIRPKSDCERVISFPSKWIKVSNSEHVVHITTQAWIGGQRYTVSEPVYIKNGIYYQR